MPVFVAKQAAEHGKKESVSVIYYAYNDKKANKK